jgi:hypothetical protein
VEVKPFGVQRLYRVELRRSRSVKTVYATAEHRWILAANKGAQWVPAESFETTTQRLQPGENLRPLQATTPAKEVMSHFAVAQGFVYGDGSRIADRNAPASLHIYDNNKDEALMPFFAHCGPRRESNRWFIYGLPRTRPASRASLASNMRNRAPAMSIGFASSV